MTAELRNITSPNHSFTWLDIHEKEFKHTKELLTQDMVIKPFHPERKTLLFTDVSCLYGMGYTLMQVDPKTQERFLVICGSKALTETQKRYATVELECLAILVAVRRCDFYLRGMASFEVITYHRSLVGIFKNDIFKLDNARIREKLIPYNFKVTWIEGKQIAIADALSRAPVFPAEEEEVIYYDTAVTYHIKSTCCFKKCFPVQLASLTEKANSAYIQLKNAVLNSNENVPNIQDAKAYKKLWTRLSISEENNCLVMLDSTRTVFPTTAVKEVVKLLHAGHPGINKARKLASQLYNWPGMTNNITQAIKNCEACQQSRPEQSNFPSITELPSEHSLAPMQTVATDLFSFQGDEYLVLVDRYSGYLCAYKLRKTETSYIIDMLWFNLLGWPKTIRSENGPQFRPEFAEFCEINEIKH